MFSATAFKCNSSDSKDGDNTGTFQGRLYTDNHVTTASGATIFSRHAINGALMPLADEGLDNLFSIAAKPPHNYTTGLSHSNYKIYLFPRSPKCDNPAFLIETGGGSGYDNSDWDKDPRPGHTAICAAGMIVGTNDFSMLVVDDVGTMATVVHFEGEHLLAWHNNPEFYEASKIHSSTNYHPILGNGNNMYLKNYRHRHFEAKSLTLSQSIQMSSKTLPKGSVVCVLLSR